MGNGHRLKRAPVKDSKEASRVRCEGDDNRTEDERHDHHSAGHALYRRA